MLTPSKYGKEFVFLLKYPFVILIQTPKNPSQRIVITAMKLQAWRVVSVLNKMLRDISSRPVCAKPKSHQGQLRPHLLWSQVKQSISQVQGSNVTDLPVSPKTWLCAKT